MSPRGSLYRGRGQDTDAPHGNQIKLRICEYADNKSTYNDSNLCGILGRDAVKSDRC
jgi:hypothetical protein